MGEPAELDYTLEVPGECMGSFRALIQAGIDALGDDAEDAAALELGKQLLTDIS